MTQVYAVELPASVAVYRRVPGTSITIRDGSLTIYDQDALVTTFAPGKWVSVKMMLESEVEDA